MKIFITALVIYFAIGTTAGQNLHSVNIENIISTQETIANTIDANDSIVFDIAQSVIAGSYVDFPVMMHSDDVINALDFSFKYNEQNFIFDTIINLTSYLQPVFNYNTIDSTLRFTSYSLQDITNDTALVLIRFAIISGQFCKSDLNTVTGYLNGDVCSSKLNECLSNGVNDINSANEEVSIYPNPASDFLKIKCDGESTIDIYDSEGRLVISTIKGNNEEALEIELKNINNGIYLIRISGRNSVITKFITVQN